MDRKFIILSYQDGVGSDMVLDSEIVDKVSQDK